jgi:hypothetical protein
MTTTLTWNDNDLDSGTDNGVVHENTANTAYDDANEIRKGDPTASPLFGSDYYVWYPMQEASGSTVYDFSGNGNDVTYNGATPDGGGNLGGAKFYGVNTPYFDGNDDYVDVPSMSSTPSSFMVSAWIYPTSIQTNRDHFIDFRGKPSVIARCGKVDNSDSFRLNFFYYDGGFSKHPTIDLSENNWYHIVGYYDGSNFGAVVDGTSYVDTSEGSPADAGGSNKIMSKESLAQSNRGCFSDFRVISPCPSNPISAAQDLYDIWANTSTHTSVVKTS